MDHAEATTDAPEEPSLSGPGADNGGVEATQIGASDDQDSADAVDTLAAAGDERAEPQSPPKPRLSLPALTTTLAPSPPPQVSPPRGATAPNKQLLFIKTSDSPSSLHSERARHQHTRKVTRDIAALDFLQNIPMKSETQPPAAAGGYAFGANYNYYDASRRGGESLVSSATAPPARVAFRMQGDGGGPQQPDLSAAEDGATGGAGGGGLAGRRLPGFEAKIVRVPPLFRYRLTTRFPAASAVVRRWESMTAQEGLLDSRVFFSRGCGYPIAAATVIKYNGNETAATAHHHHHHHGARKRFLSVGGMEPQSYDWRGKSYYRLLHATWAPCDRDRDSQDDHPSSAPYVANYLDDPEFRQGRHRHVVRGDKNIGPVVSSILLFVKPHELKEELNKKFREKHTWLHDHELSLSKIRNLKRETLTTGQRLNMEVATIALACVYFEKLVLSHYVNKANRKLYMSVCLLLAAKFNEPKASDAMKLMIKQILAEIDATHSLPSREVLTIEFKIYAQLSFSLHVPLAELQPHFTRLLKLVESNPRKYLDEDVFNDYSKLVLEEKTVASRAQNDTVLSMDGETQDEGTDAEALMSDEDIEGDEGMEDDDAHDGTTAQRLRKESDAGRRRASLPPWSRMPSIAQWWRERTQDGDQPIAARSHETVDQDVASNTERAPSMGDTAAQ